jgi:hypothetical protein
MRSSKMTLGALGVCGFCLATSVNAQEQEMSALSQSIITAVQTRESGWELEHRVVRGDELTHRWKHGHEDLVIAIDRAATVEEATSRLDAVPRQLSVSARPQHRTDIGDAALMYSRYGPTGSAVIYFRKRTMFIKVSGPSENITVRFARLVANEIR